MKEIKSDLIEWFSTKANIDKEIIKEQTHKNYFEEKWLDSLTFLELVVFLENNFSIKFSNTEFQNKKFATIDGLTEIIEEKLQ